MFLIIEYCEIHFRTISFLLPWRIFWNLLSNSLICCPLDINKLFWSLLLFCVTISITEQTSTHPRVSSKYSQFLTWLFNTIYLWRGKIFFFAKNHPLLFSRLTAAVWRGIRSISSQMPHRQLFHFHQTVSSEEKINTPILVKTFFYPRPTLRKSDFKGERSFTLSPLQPSPTREGGW